MGFLESIEVMRLRTDEGRYITADEDRVSVALSKPCSNVSAPKNTEWKAVWLEAKKCRLKSIYENLLAVGDCLVIIQESCPVSKGSGDWCLPVTNLSCINAKEFQAALEHVSESRYLNTTDNGVCLGSTDEKWPYAFPKIWTVEVVKSNNNSEQKTNHDQHLLQRAMREDVDVFWDQWKWERERDWEGEREREWKQQQQKWKQDQQRQQEQERKQKQQLQQKWKQRQQQYFVAGPPNSMMCGYYKLATPRLKPYRPYTSACISQSNWPVQQLDHAEQLLNCEQEPKKSNSTNNSNTPPPLPPPPTTTTTTTTTITASKEVAVVTTPISNNGGHHQLIKLTGCQVGQVMLTCFTPGVGGDYSHYNSGHNVNGSGTQTNGDVHVHTAVGNTRDVSVNINSYTS